MQQQDTDSDSDKLKVAVEKLRFSNGHLKGRDLAKMKVVKKAFIKSERERNPASRQTTKVHKKVESVFSAIYVKCGPLMFILCCVAFNAHTMIKCMPSGGISKVIDGLEEWKSTDEWKSLSADFRGEDLIRNVFDQNFVAALRKLDHTRLEKAGLRAPVRDRQPLQQVGTDCWQLQQPGEECQSIQQPGEECQPVQQASAECQPLQQPREERQPLQQPREECQPVQQASAECQPLQQPEEEYQSLQQPGEDCQPLQQPREEYRPMQQPSEEYQLFQQASAECQPMQQPKEYQPLQQPKEEYQPLQQASTEYQPLQQANTEYQLLQQANTEYQPLQQASTQLIPIIPANDPPTDHGPTNEGFWAQSVSSGSPWTGSASDGGLSTPETHGPYGNAVPAPMVYNSDLMEAMRIAWTFNTFNHRLELTPDSYSRLKITMVVDCSPEQAWSLTQDKVPLPPSLL
ncbi:unnamed protein product [Clonostachys rhizophaga]|uniref:Uncharacterized protein n=1 Tax=Clonostachys rhizophaga TaxID=160324 RepID=A0A9N9YH15_9HYPO|nr:unnamed protein product [Clonostachys rhizophaga]